MAREVVGWVATASLAAGLGALAAGAPVAAAVPFLGSFAACLIALWIGAWPPVVRRVRLLQPAPLRLLASIDEAQRLLQAIDRPGANFAELTRAVVDWDNRTFDEVERGWHERGAVLRLMYPALGDAELSRSDLYQILVAREDLLRRLVTGGA